MTIEPTPDKGSNPEPKPHFESGSLSESMPLLTPTQQRRKAGQLLQWLQWLLILVIAAMMIWLFVSQQRFEQEVLTRLQTSEQVSTRLNEMDDRLFAISQQTLPAQDQQIGSQAQNQLDMLRIQLQAADRLIEDSNYKAVVALLRGLLWQLSQDSNEIAPALTIVIKQSLEQDIERLQAQSAQPSPWQLHNLAIADIQAYLRRQVATAQLPRKAGEAQRLAAYDVMVHETIMTLNLAMQASNMRDQSLLLMYLQQAKQQLQPLQNMDGQLHVSPSSPLTAPKVESDGATDSSSDATSANTSSTSKPKGIDNLASMHDALNWIDKLIAEPPTETTLLTSQVLASEKSKPTVD